jgi:hypothetical protein
MLSTDLSEPRLVIQRIRKAGGGRLVMVRRFHITWLKDRSLAFPDNLPDLNVLTEEIGENLEMVLAFSASSLVIASSEVNGL